MQKAFGNDFKSKKRGGSETGKVIEESWQPAIEGWQVIFFLEEGGNKQLH